MSTLQELKQLLESQKQFAASQGGGTLAEVRAEWVQAVNDLMEQCRSWLGDLEADGLVAIRGMSEAEEKDSVDDVLGAVRTKRLVIETPFGIEIRMVPSRRYVSEDLHGRVEIFAGGEYHTLVRDKNGTWFRVSKPGGLEKLTQESFCALVLDIARSVQGQIPAA